MKFRITDDEVIARSTDLPAFPRVLELILKELDRAHCNIGLIASYIERDPVIAGRIISLAYTMGAAEQGTVRIKTVYGAISRIGLGRTKAVVLAMTEPRAFRDRHCPLWFWEHSVAVSLCAQELARYVRQVPDYALIAGLLHDIGQLWLLRFYGKKFVHTREQASLSGQPISSAELDVFGMTHGEIGAQVAIGWGLPNEIVESISEHHLPRPDVGLLASITHVAEVIVNALNFGNGQKSQVAYLSGHACALLGLNWENDLNPLFGRVEARTAYACQIFQPCTVDNNEESKI